MWSIAKVVAVDETFLSATVPPYPPYVSRLCPAFFKRPMDVLDAPDSLAIVRQEWVTEVLRRGSFFKPGKI